jgi:DNA-binding GntR family transcriptional regulator
MGRVTEVDIGSGELLSTTARVDADGRIVRRHAADLVGEVIRRMIFDGDLRAGDKVPQDELAARLGVSRLPVREALTGLARDGLVTVEPHLGAYVAPFDDDTIRDHFEIVGMVQGLAGVRLAQIAPAETLVSLHLLRTQVEESTGLEPVHRATMAFHRVINREGGSERQRSVLRALARMLPSGFFVDVPGAIDSEQRGVARIDDALQRRSTRATRTACLEVQRERGDLVVEHLRNRGVFTDQ